MSGWQCLGCGSHNVGIKDPQGLELINISKKADQDKLIGNGWCFECEKVVGLQYKPLEEPCHDKSVARYCNLCDPNIHA